jgi:hypothetical protein
MVEPPLRIEFENLQWIPELWCLLTSQCGQSPYLGEGAEVGPHFGSRLVAQFAVFFQALVERVGIRHSAAILGFDLGESDWRKSQFTGEELRMKFSGVFS